jgi:hypothetical protein
MLIFCGSGGRIRSTTPALPKVTVVFEETSNKLTLNLEKMPVGNWGPLSKSPKDPVMLSGELSIAIPTGDTNKIEGALSATLDGVVLPHPSELDDIMAGDQAKLGASFELTKESLELKDVKLSEGALALKGRATLSLAHGGHVDSTLEGSIACSQIAGSVLGSKLGGGGLLAKSFAGAAVSGDVGVKLHLLIDAPDFTPHLEPSIDMGCKLGL